MFLDITLVYLKETKQTISSIQSRRLLTKCTVKFKKFYSRFVIIWIPATTYCVL